MVTVAFLGLGRMGLAMAGRLRSTGVKLRVFNRTASRADTLVATGARRCATPREACAGAVGAFSMVADDAASRAIWLGADGALGALPSGAMLIECSTLSHDWVLELSARAAAVDVRYLDAPVTGLPEQAAAGALTLLVGAHRADLEAARPLLDALARSIIHFGPVGAGTAYKLLVNLLGSGQAASPQVIRNTRRMAENQHAEPVHFTPQLRLKDVEYALALARKLGAGAPFGALAARWFGQLAESMPAGINESAIIDVARRQHP